MTNSNAKLVVFTTAPARPVSRTGAGTKSWRVKPANRLSGWILPVVMMSCAVKVSIPTGP